MSETESVSPNLWQPKPLDNRAFYDMLKILFADPCLILMIGDWRTGKTDTSLLIGYLAKKWGLISEIGSNIYTFNNPATAYITSMGGLRRWLFHDRETKLFVFDEALSHIPARTAMSKKNVDIVRIIAELSKAHGRMIFCSQTEKVEGTLKDTAFLRAVMRKKTKHILTVRSNLFEDASFYPIPRSPIHFDADRLAEFVETEGIEFDSLSLEVKCASRYADGQSLTKIEKELGVHRDQVKDYVRKVIRAYLKRESVQVIKPENPVQSASEP